MTQEVLRFIAQNEGCTSIDVANALPVDHVVYGRQRATSSAIALLRKAGLIKDCPRCPTCDRALSRGQRNVPLSLTAAGRKRARD